MAKEKFKPIKFPEDEQGHDHAIEWWYFNGHLKDKYNKDYAFMSCLFKVNVRKMKIPFLTKSPINILYFSHSILSDINNNKFYPYIDYISILSEDSFSKPLLFINYTSPMVITGYVNRVIEETQKFVYRLKDKNVDLRLISVKKPLLEGGDGYVDLKTRKVFYYSLTNLKTDGKIKIKNKWIDVTGKFWMDHQWADTTYSKNKWNWFSIQLDNKTEIVCFEYDDAKNKTYLASVSYPDNRQEHFEKVEFTPLGTTWTSPKTKAVYPLTWRIKALSKNINLEVAPLIKEQEIIYGPINYWEGPINVSGLFNGKKVKGVGFMELAGYPSKYYNLKHTKDEIEKFINQIFSYAKKETVDIVGNIKTKIIK